MSGLKDIFQVFDHLVILSMSEEREEAAACLSEGCGKVTAEGEVIGEEIKEIFPESRRDDS